MSSTGAPRAAARGSNSSGGGVAARPPSGGIMENRAAGGAHKTSSGAKPVVGQQSQKLQQPPNTTPSAAAGSGYGKRPTSGGAGAPATNGVGQPASQLPPPPSQSAMKPGPRAGSAGSAGAAAGGAPTSGSAGAANPYGGSMYGPGGSSYGGMNDNYGGADGGAMGGDMGGMNGYGSMYGAQNGGMGSMYGGGGGGMGMNPMMGSMYGMGGGAPMGSMYGMGSMYNGGMGGGSMYGMNGGMGSMYGMNPMMGGSMYGMGGPMMGSMYGMGGGAPMGSMYGMGGGGMGSMMMARSMSFSSYGGGSMYGSMYGGSMYGGGMGGSSSRSIGGMWGVESGYRVRSRRERDMPTMSKMLKDDEDEAKKPNLVKETLRMREKEGKAGAAGKEAEKKEEEAKEAAAAADSPEDKKKKEEAAAAAASADKKDAKDGADKKEGADKDGKAKAADEKDGKRALGAVKKDGEKEGKKGEEATGPEDTNAIHSIVVVEDAKSTRVKVEKAEPGHKVIIQGPAGKPAEVKATDVLSGPEADLKACSVMNMLASHVKSGHNVCLLAIDTKPKMTPLFTKAITAFFTDALAKLGSEVTWKVAFSASAINGPAKFRDLSKPDAAPADIIFGSNPIFGPCVMEAAQTSLKDVAAVEKAVAAALAAKADPQEMLLLQAIVHLRKGKDLFLCSLNAFVLRALDVAEAAAILDDRRVPVPVLRAAIGGATRTAALVSVTGAEDAAATEAEVLRVTASLAAKENLSPRSGNVPRFIEYTDEQIAKVEKDMPNLSGETKERRQHMVEKMRTMAADAKELIANPDAEAKVYPIHTKSAAGGAASPGTAKEAAISGIRGPASPPMKSGAVAEGGARRLPAKDGPGGAQPDAAAGPAAMKAAAVSGAAAVPPAASGAAKLPPGGAVSGAAAGANPAAAPFSSIHRLVYMRDGKTASVGKVVEVVVGGETKAYDVDECIDCPVGEKAASLQESKELERMGGILCSGCNVAVLGAELLAPAVPAEQMTWRYVKQVLSTLLASSTPAATHEVALYMSVLHERQVVADLISGATTPRTLVVATSPLFGPLVHESAAAKVHNPEEMAATIDKGLALAAPHMAKEGTLVVLTAVVKQVLPNDVRVASLFAVAAPDMGVYKAIIERSPQYSRSLFTYALGGPASTALIIAASRNMDQSVLATALSTQRSVSHMKVPSPRNGSVKEFAQYARESLERQKKRTAAMADGPEKEQALNSMRRLGESLHDHEELLANPKAVEVRAYPPEVPAGQTATSPSAARSGQAMQPMPKASPQSVPPSAAAAAASAQTPGERQRATPRQAQRAVKVQPQEEKEKEEAAPAPAAAVAAPADAPAAAKSVSPAAEAVPEKSESSTQGSRERPQSTHPIKFLAIVTEETRAGTQVKEGWSVAGSGNELIVTDVEGPHTFEVDEVANRPQRSGPVVAAVLDELRGKFLEGENVALLATDARGSSSSLETVDRSVRSILAKTPTNRSLYISINSLKEASGEVLDTLNEEDVYKPIEVKTSPLFGPVVAGAAFHKISTVDEFARMMSVSVRKCGAVRSCVVVQLLQVEVKPEESDVSVNSFLGIMSPGDISLYRRALDLPIRERGLLSLAFGGSCHTVFSAGLTKDPADENCLLLPRFAQALKAAVRNLKPRANSMKRFIEHTKGAVTQVQQNIARATSDEEKTKMQAYLETVQHMVETSEAYLADPENKTPPTYPLNNRPDRREL